MPQPIEDLLNDERAYQPILGNDDSCCKKLCIYNFIFAMIFLLISIVVSILYFFPKNPDKPIIGIVSMKNPPNPSSTYYDVPEDRTNNNYIRAVILGGGIPISISLMDTYTDEDIESQVSLIHGIIFQGGDDITPELYNQTKDPKCGKTNIEMDKNHLSILKAAQKRKIPILGICRGHQLINIACGGSLYQDLSLRKLPTGTVPDDHRHLTNYSLPIHSISIAKNTFLYSLFGSSLNVNSLHHQVINKLAPGFIVTATSPDGAVEGIEKIAKGEWIVGVQFHPEGLLAHDNTTLPFFKKFVQIAKE